MSLETLMKNETGSEVDQITVLSNIFVDDNKYKVKFVWKNYSTDKATGFLC